MASRPIFVPKLSGPRFVDEIMLDFTWIPGMAASQKMKNVVSLHQAAHRKGYASILEISTKSQLALGESLSAFNLMLENPSIGRIPVEAAFQGSKVFESGGPYREFYRMSGRDIRRDDRLRNSGRLLGFDFAGVLWQLEPKTAFYDWLYLTALAQNPDLSSQIANFDGFSDIEFNPEKSINCQARAAALYVSLRQRGLLEKVMLDKASYFQVVAANPDPIQKPPLRQSSLF